jgi:tRNA C32,U32 (ribose-2'-O)-methylase TrmJ
VAVCLYELGRGTKTVATKNSARRENNTNKGANSENKHLENTKRDSSDSKLAVEKRLATMEIVDRITAALLEALYTSGYVAPKASALAEEKLRRMIRRFHLEAADAEVFLGMIHKILWKLGQT